MKRLSDYSGEQAIEVAGKLLEPLGDIIADKEIMNKIQNGENIIKICGKILTKYPQAAYKMVSIVDDAQITGGNAFPRFIAVFSDLISDKDFSAFFGTAVTTE